MVNNIKKEWGVELQMDLKKISIPYLLLGLTYILYYFTHIPELYIVLGLLYIYLAFKH